MPISFACAFSHAPGILAWSDAAPAHQRDALHAGFDTLGTRLAAAELDALVLFTSEHWANFFLDHISPYCLGRAKSYKGPVEPWLKMDKVEVPGDPTLGEEILRACYDGDVDLGFTYEMQFDHGTMVPLNFLTPRMDVPVVPIMINTWAAPQPSARRCLTLGKIVGEVARKSGRRIGLVATGGMSHDPGEVNHGLIDQDFDRRFLADMAAGDLQKLSSYSIDDLARAGAGTIELLGWIALAGALGTYHGEIVAYEAVVPWATGIGLMSFEPQAAV
jgi:aromatic ring-opening dioxygenase catalytic subunit (LigB family)